MARIYRKLNDFDGVNLSIQAMPRLYDPPKAAFPYRNEVRKVSVQPLALKLR